MYNIVYRTCVWQFFNNVYTSTKNIDGNIRSRIRIYKRYFYICIHLEKHRIEKRSTNVPEMICSYSEQEETTSWLENIRNDHSIQRCIKKQHMDYYKGHLR